MLHNERPPQWEARALQQRVAPSKKKKKKKWGGQCGGCGVIQGTSVEKEAKVINVSHRKEFCFYSEWHGKTLEGSEERSEKTE